MEPASPAGCTFGMNLAAGPTTLRAAPSSASTDARAQETCLMNDHSHAPAAAGHADQPADMGPSADSIQDRNAILVTFVVAVLAAVYFVAGSPMLPFFPT